MGEFCITENVWKTGATGVYQLLLCTRDEEGGEKPRATDKKVGDTNKRRQCFCFFLSFWLCGVFSHCCTQGFSGCGEWGLLFVVVHGLCVVMASLVVEHWSTGSRHLSFGSGSTRAQ